MDTWRSETPQAVLSWSVVKGFALVSGNLHTPKTNPVFNLHVTWAIIILRDVGASLLETVPSSQDNTFCWFLIYFLNQLFFFFFISLLKFKCIK